MLLVYIMCAAALIISLLADPKKTWSGVKSGTKLFMKALPTFLGIILIMVVFLYLVSPQKITNALSTSNNTINMLLASLLGSIVVVPGFIAFPLAGVLKDLGAGYGVLAALTTTLMMVGVLTYPLEKKYFGAKFAVIRNIVSFIIALTASFVIHLVLDGGLG